MHLNKTFLQVKKNWENFNDAYKKFCREISGLEN